MTIWQINKRKKRFILRIRGNGKQSLTIEQKVGNGVNRC